MPLSYPRLALICLIAAGPCRFGSTAADAARSGHLRRRAQQEEPQPHQHEQRVIDDSDEPPLGDPIMPPQVSLIALQFTADPHAGRDRLEMVLSGELRLAAVRYAPTSFNGGNGIGNGDEDNTAYSDVYGEFCDYDPALNGADPTAYPTTSAILAESEHCGEHRYSMPLKEVVKAVHQHDNNGIRKSSSPMRTLPVSGLLFHEGYAGAGLLANALASFGSALVVSEHPALREALSACDTIRNRYKSDNCRAPQQRQLVQDVVALLSRSPEAGASKKLYLKLSSASAAYLPELRSIYPDAPWAFVYRDAAQALEKHTRRHRRAVCLKARRNPSAALSDRAADRGHDLEALAPHEVCALHLASLLGAASSEHERTGTGTLLSYGRDLDADSLIGTVLPYLGLGEEVEADPQAARDRVEEVLSRRSDASGRRAHDPLWRGENTEISEEITEASHVFMGDATEALRRMR